MTDIFDIVEELNQANGSNYKISVLEKYRDNDLLKRVLKMTYDKVVFTYGISMKNITYTPENRQLITLTEALDFIESNFVTRVITGNQAINQLTNTLESLQKTDAKIVEGIINRDLRINMGRSNINKVFKKLIVKPPYQRCSLMDKISRITYPAIVEAKLDGTYRSVIKDGENVSVISRSGEESYFPKFAKKFRDHVDGVYIGELLIRSLPGSKNRAKANGLINSDQEQDDMYIVLWDYLTLDEYAAAKSSRPYKERFDASKKSSDGIESVEYKIVYNFQEAKDFYKAIIKAGGEGAVLKNMNAPFKDGTSQENIKMKEEAVAEFIVTGFQEGNNRLENSLGALFYRSSDGLVEGKMSGFSDKKRLDVWQNQDKYIDTIVSVKYNGVSKSKGSKTYALMYANFVDFREDKDEADDLEYIKNALK